MRNKIIWILIGGILTAGFRGEASANFIDPEILLGSPKQAFELPSIKKIEAEPSQNLAERYKIEYLILRVKKSSYLFIRNGEEHKGERASMHLRMKYYKRFGLIKTADKFISDIASFSNSSGESYQVKYPDGAVYLLKDVFANELALLNKFLAPKSPDVG